MVVLVAVEKKMKDSVRKKKQIKDGRQTEHYFDKLL